MALIKCQECGHEVSDQAESCPHCGHPAPEGAGNEPVLHDVSPSLVWTHPFSFFISLILCLAGIGLIFLLILWLNCRSVRLVVSTRRSTLRRGLIAKHVTEVLHRDVKNLQVDQGIFQRMIGIGSLSMSSAGQADVEIRIDGIRDPERVAQTIRQYQ